MHTLTRLRLPYLIRRWLDVRAAEAARKIAVDAIFEAGREHERRLAGAAR